MNKNLLVIDVTQNHIDRAIARKNKRGRSAQVNPVEIAINDKTHRMVFATGRSIEYPTTQNKWRIFSTPRAAASFIERFNSNKKVRPFTLVIKPSMEIA